ncbi:hypothetical protein SAY86_008599 [Trapa natans]|uniref:HTH myb-type domain-containing protein n=1 Tax=Trapa natans TaxID=22666 RepID=A0AAN7KF17_TRANT|nr:hypothetical protein SAY86_008599 [Trapa natans]
MTEYETGVHLDEDENDDAGNDDRVHEWELGLPAADDLTPLSQALISPELASAFSITPEPSRTLLDVNRASKSTLAALRGNSALSQGFSTNNNFKSAESIRDSMDAEQEEPNRYDSRKSQRIESPEEADSAVRADNSVDDPSARTAKRPRLVWTPQLHKRFVEVVAHLGIKNAVPKTIMQLMNVEGLTRENVASHLQKYRLYLKRMQGLPGEDLSSSDQLFASTPVPQSLRENGAGTHSGHGNGHIPVPVPMPYGATPIMPMPVYGMSHQGPGGDGLGYHGFESNPYMVQQRDWSGNRYGQSVVSRTHPAGPNEK